MEGKLHIEIAPGGPQSWSFTSPEQFLDWLRVESSVWAGMFIDSQIDSADPIAPLGEVGAREHVDEYKAVVSALDEAMNSDWNEEARHQAVLRVSEEVSRQILSRGLIVSTTPLGQKVKSLSRTDMSAAKLAISLATGRNISRVTAPQNSKALWRAIPRITSASASDAADDVVQGLSEALGSARIQAAEVSAVAVETKAVLDKAKADSSEQFSRRENELEGVLKLMSEQTAAAIEAVNREWVGLKATYASEFALRAPVAYWRSRRNVHRFGAAVWGVLSCLFVSVLIIYLIPNAVEKFEDARWLANAKNSGWIIYLPEIFQVGVVAFLSLWVLRFFVRQVSEHLARSEEASQRVTMAETFLALSSPGEGNPPLVGDADRAVIVQALFRPSGVNGIDDAPPAHWIEDVFRRIKSKDSQGT